MKIEILPKAKKQLAKLDKTVVRQIKGKLTEIEALENPRSIGKQLLGNLSLYWRYRVGDFRILCEIKDEVLTIFVVKIGHRKNIYLNK